MSWQDDPAREMRLLFDGAYGPGLLYNLEREFWLELYRAPVVDAVREDGIETRFYGPIQATITADMADDPLFNIVLGASDPDAVQGGHLAAALDWIESKGVDCRVPVRPEFEESGAAEDELNRRGYRRSGRLARFVRDAASPAFAAPPGVDVEEWTEELEGFSYYLAEGYGIHYLNSFFGCLPERGEWRCYVAADKRTGHGVGAAAMMQHYRVAQLGFAATTAEGRGLGVNMALLHRCMVDARAADSELLFADVEEPCGDAEPSSRAAQNLERAGFCLASIRQVWRPARGAET